MNEDRLFAKLEKIDEKLANIDKTLAINTLSLEEHIKRTNLLQAKLEPVEAHVEQMRAWGRMIKTVALFTAGVAAFAAAVVKAIGRAS